MIGVSTTITGDDLSSRGSGKAMRVASDWTWDYHRRRYMPFHFKKAAFLRYKEYSKRKKKNSGRSRRKKDNRDGKTRLVKEQMKREAGKLRAERLSTGKTIRESKLPLVRSGYMRNKILRGQVKHTGKNDKRGISYSAPRYTYITPPGSMDKAAALRELSPVEEKDIVDKLSIKFFENLEKRKLTKKG